MRSAPELVGQVEELDERIDRDEIEIHALILRILALRQPVADDLRFLAIGAPADHRPRAHRRRGHQHHRADREGGGEAKSLVRGDLAAMADDVRDMLHEALEAFVQSDADAAEHVLGRDEAVDRRCATIIAAMTTHMSRKPSEVLAGLRVIRVAKYLERIADHATNVAEQVIFMVRGDDVRHGRWRR